MKSAIPIALFGIWFVIAVADAAAEPITVGAMASRSFVDSSQIVSKYATELYAHHCSMRIVDGMGYVAYQCNENSKEENVAGQIVRLAIFNILNPTATARWLDVSGPGDSANGLTISGGGKVSVPPSSPSLPASPRRGKFVAPDHCDRRRRASIELAL